MSKHFCTCPVDKCNRHPSNHNDGCDPCVKDNIMKKKMPACMFLVVNEDVSELKDFSIKSFVEHFLRHQDTSTNK